MISKTIVRMVVGFLVLASLSGCYPGVYGQQGGFTGGIAGAAGGAVLDRRDPLRGAIVGGVLGTVFGGILGNIADQSAYAASSQQQVVRTPLTDGSGRYFESRPHGHYDDGCTRVHVRLYDRYGQLRQEEWRKVCR